MNVRKVAALASVLLILGVASFAAQGPQRLPVDERFRVSTYLVTVDVSVTGKKGRPVLVLKPEDFLIFEDDVLQKLEFFQADPTRAHRPLVIPLSNGEPQSNPAAGAEASNPTITRELSNPIVLLLDYSTTTVANQKLVRDGARKYISKSMDGQDLMAVFAFDSGLRSLQGFTRDREKLLASLVYSGSRGEAMQGESASLASGAAQMVRKQEGLQQQIGNVLGAAASGTSMAAIGPALAMTQAQLDMARQTELQYYALKNSLDDQLSRSILLAIHAIAEGLTLLPGRKSLVLLSQGFTVPPNVRQILDDALKASIRSNTAIYAIDARGLVNDKPTFQTTELESISALQRGTRTRVVNGESEFDRAAVVGTDQEESLLRFLSLTTGGLYLRNNNDLAHGLKLVDDDVHAHYLLAYTTTNKKMDGNFRTIRVQVRPKGLKVRARKGYYAIP